MSQETSYDRVPYAALSFPQQNPARLGAVAALFGLRPAAPSKCRVLELGCGQGLTALSVAELFPGSEVVGIDLSRKHIDGAIDLQKRAGITNVRFEAASILDVTEEAFGTFDYITCHGVFSWVPEAVREKILSICGTQLRENGIAYVSFNALPGWGPLKALRDIFAYHAARFDTPQEKFEKCKALVALLRDFNAQRPQQWQAAFYQFGAGLVEKAEPSYFLHEYLEEDNHPMFFHEFMAVAERHGLQFISDLQVGQSLPGSLGPQFGGLVEFLRRSPVDAQQYIDFFRNTQFHSTLLCRSGVALDRSLRGVPMDPYLFAGAPTASATPINLAPGADAEFVFPNGGKYKTADPLAKAILVQMVAHRNQFLAIPELAHAAVETLKKNNIAVPADALTGARAMLSQMMGNFLASGFVEISLPDNGRYVGFKGVPKQPFAPALVRAQAQAHQAVLRTSLFSSPVRREIALLLAVCDGSRSLQDLFEIYRRAIAEGTIPHPPPPRHDQPADVAAAFKSLMQEMANSGLFWLRRS